MNAARYRHSRVHMVAAVYFNNHFPDYEWLIDFDFHTLNEDGAFVIRPDVAGVKSGKIEVVVEVSDSTIHKDLTTKKQHYATAGISYYVVLDCSSKQAYQFQLIGTQYEEKEIFGDLKCIFKSVD